MFSTSTGGGLRYLTPDTGGLDLKTLLCVRSRPHLNPSV